MRTFIVTMLFVLALQANLFVTLGAEHLVYALLCSIGLCVGIKLEEKSIAKELKENIRSGSRHISKIIPVITKEIAVLKNTAVKQGATS